MLKTIKEPWTEVPALKPAGSKHNRYMFNAQ